MITHIVVFKLKEPSPENIRKTKEALEGLWGKVPQLKRLEVGTDVVRSARSYDIALVAGFSTLSELEAYRSHPAHLEVLERINKVRESSITVDYESER